MTTNRHFKDGAWDGPGPRLVIYDSAFINENVYAGIASITSIRETSTGD